MPPVAQTPGLWTTPNRLSAPDGALRVADNCVIRSRDCVEPRRGQELIETALDDSDGLTLAGFSTGGYALLHQGNSRNVSEYLSGDVVTATGSLHGVNLVGSGSPWTFGDFLEPDPFLMRMHFARMLGRTYFTSDKGPMRLITGGISTDTPRRTGMPAPRVQWSTSHPKTTTGGFLDAAGGAVGYRASLLLKDSQGRQVQSAPSARVVINQPGPADLAIGGLVRASNITTATFAVAHGFKPGDVLTLSPGEADFAAGQYTVASVPTALTLTYIDVAADKTSLATQTLAFGDAGVDVDVWLPPVEPTTVGLLTTATVLQIWRTETASPGVDPGENYYLVMERRLATGTDLTNWHDVFSDNTPDVMLGPAAYFSADADTLLKSKARPAWCKTLAQWGSRMVFANTRDKHSMVVQLLSTGGSAGVQTADTLTLTVDGTDYVFTFRAHFDALTQTTTLFQGGSVATDIQNTALALVDCLNSLASDTGVEALYLSGPDDSPGQILLRRTYDSTNAFTVTCSRPIPWNPQLPASAPLTTSAQVAFKNRLYYSEPHEPDAVPELQYDEVGEPDEEVLRCLPLRDNLVVVKERSIWAVSGEWPNTRVTQLDATLSIVGPDTAAVVANQVYMLSTQGVVAISGVGVGVVGLPVEDDFLATMVAEGLLTLPYYSHARRMAWGASYDTDRTYLLAIGSNDDRCAQLVYCYNVLAKTWTRWPTARSWGFVDVFANRLLLGDGARPALRRERKSLTRDDMVDEVRLEPDGSNSFELESVDATAGTVTMTVGSPLGDIAIGDGLTQGGARAVVLAIDAGTRVLTVSSTDGFIAAAVLVYASFECAVEWLPETGGSPATAKQGKEAHLHFQYFQGHLGETHVGSELTAAAKAHTFSEEGWGAIPYGTAPYGSPLTDRNERSLFARDASRGSYLQHSFRMREAWQWWRLQGRTIDMDVGGEKSRR